jgi:indole-3-acetate monooxygenase
MVSTTADPVAAVRALQPDVRAAAEQTERDRKPTAAIIEKLLDAGLFDLIKPKSIGGAETDVITMMRVIEEASIADASIGWCVGIGVGTSIMAGSVSEAVAREVFAPKTVQGGAFAPTGRGTLEGGGIRVTGRWQFASGSPHCSWLSGGTIVFDGDAPRMMAPDMPDWRMPLFPRADTEIIDTWHTGGMRGTGSNDIAVKDLFVPDDHVVMMGRTEPVQSGPLYRYPIIGFLALTIAPVATGMARRAIDETMELAQTKVALGTRKTVKDRAIAQHLLAEAEAELRAGRAFMYEAAHEIWDTMLRGDTATMQQRAVLRLACVHATNASVKAVDIAYRMGGGTAIYETSVLQRIMRDVHTVTQHVQLSTNNYEAVGRVLMGLDPGPFPF